MGKVKALARRVMLKNFDEQLLTNKDITAE